VARTPERMTLLKRTIATARSFGIEAEFITPAEALELWPLMRIDDLVGAVWLPGDGKANPTDLTQSLAKGARNRGAKVFEGVQITGTLIEHGRIVGVETNQGTVRCESFLNCAGQWARELGKMSGVTSRCIRPSTSTWSPRRSKACTATCRCCAIPTATSTTRKKSAAS
jgi:glycine/D-amino acid oxidase-like deaminating enzyme